MYMNIFTKHNVTHIDYKDTAFLKRFIDPYGRIKPRRATKVPATYQRKITRAIKQARYMGLLPYISS